MNILLLVVNSVDAVVIKPVIALEFKDQKKNGNSSIGHIYTEKAFRTCSHCSKWSNEFLSCTYDKCEKFLAAFCVNCFKLIHPYCNILKCANCQAEAITVRNSHNPTCPYFKVDFCTPCYRIKHSKCLRCDLIIS